MANTGEPLSRVKAERPFTGAGAAPPSPRLKAEIIDALEENRAAAEAQRAYLRNSAQLTPNRKGRRPRPKVYEHSDWLEIARKAFGKTAKWKRPWSAEWDASGDCQDPRRITVEARQRPLSWRYAAMSGPEYRLALAQPTAWLDIDVPCRRCANCLARRAAHWRLRARAECAAATRTWACTLTFKPAVHARVTLEASKRIGLVTFGSLTPSEELLERNVECGQRVTKYLKRLRKESGASLRYCLVMEAHESGLPHYHLLLHETGAVPIRWAVLNGQWRREGFGEWHVVDDGPKAAAYVSKYLSKSMLARVRASVRYGQAACTPSGIGDGSAVHRET